LTAGLRFGVEYRGDLMVNRFHVIRLARSTLPPIYADGRPLVLALIASALVGRRLWRPAGTLGLGAATACALFFRDPPRVPPARADVVVAAADGLVNLVDEAPPPPEIGLGPQPLPRVSVFLSVFDVHVQRIPMSGTVRQVAYRQGAFLSADRPEASVANERNTLLLRNPAGQEVVVAQVAGLVARRIVCRAGVGDQVEIGKTYGMIRFGSRVDVYLPVGSAVQVRVGQRVIGGETVLAELPPPDGVWA
jgi:phosphatidylserine decarboxylase